MRRGRSWNLALIVAGSVAVGACGGTPSPPAGQSPMLVPESETSVPATQVPAAPAPPPVPEVIPFAPMDLRPGNDFLRTTAPGAPGRLTEIRALPRPLTGIQALALAAELTLDDQGEAALRELASLSPMPDLAPWVELWRARALEAAGRPTDARNAWEALYSSAAATESIRAAAGEALIQAARAAGGVAAERAWLVRRNAAAPEPRFYARLAELAADAAERANWLAELMARFPWSSEALAAVEGLPSDTPPSSAAGIVWYRHSRYPAAEKTLSEALAAEGDAPAAATLYYLAATLDDTGRNAESVVLYDRVPGTSGLAPRARWWSARALEDAGDLALASTRYRDVALGGGPFAEEAAFRAGWVLYVEGDVAAAELAWGAVAASSAEAAFWQARAIEQQGRDAVPSLGAVAAADPDGLFGALAAIRLGRLGAIPDWRVSAAPERAPNAGEAPMHLPLFSASVVIDELLAVGWRDEASELLEAETAAGAIPVWFAATVAAEGGMWELLPRLALVPNAETGDVHRERMAYPLGFPAELRRAAAEFGLDPLLLAALVRQESLWDADAVSVADARGLTQVIPVTAAGIAEALGADMFHVEHLFEPATSLRFGAFYLREQLDTFRSPLVALAAYNAGPGNAARWASESDDPADFLVAIDFIETRDYVQRVMENWLTYRRLYGP